MEALAVKRPTGAPGQTRSRVWLAEEFESIHECVKRARCRDDGVLSRAELPLQFSPLVGLFLGNMEFSALLKEQMKPEAGNRSSRCVAARVLLKWHEKVFSDNPELREPFEVLGAGGVATVPEHNREAMKKAIERAIKRTATKRRH